MNPAPATGFRVVLGSEEAPTLVGWNAAALQDAAAAGPAGPAAAGAESLESWALRTPDGVVLVEPRLPAEQPADVARYLEPLLAWLGAPLGATVMTTPNHERAMYLIQEHTGAPAWGPAPVRPEALDQNDAFWGTPSRLYSDGDALPGGLRAMRVDRWLRGDGVLHWRAPTGEGVLFTGDAVCVRPSRRDEREPPCLHLLCRQVDEQPGPEARRETFRRLLEEEFSLICPGHNGPLRDRARERLAETVERGESVYYGRNAFLIEPIAR